jgi:hypothetical protein
LNGGADWLRTAEYGAVAATAKRSAVRGRGAGKHECLIPASRATLYHFLRD